MAPSSAETSLDTRRWLVISIFLHVVLIPPLRGIIARKIELVYDLKKRKNHIDTQTHSKYLCKIFPGARRDLNHESINGNNHRDPENFDYKVVNAVSLAKLLVKPSMAKFTAFDDSFDILQLPWPYFPMKDYSRIMLPRHQTTLTPTCARNGHIQITVVEKAWYVRVA